MLDLTVYKIIPLNVRGLKNQQKGRYMNKKSEWGGEMLFSHGY